MIVGAFAVMTYSEPRYTKDLDIWVGASEDNAERVFAALAEFGAPLAGMSVSDFATDGFFQMGQPPVRIDIMMSVDGVTFGEAWPNRQDGDFDGIPSVFIGRDDLLVCKAAAGRPQDILDINSIQTPRLKF